MSEKTETLKKSNPFLEEHRRLVAEQAKRDAANKELAKSVGSQFQSAINPGQKAKVVGFEPEKELRGRRAPAYLINLGNPNASHFIHCDDFNEQYKPVTEG